MRPTRDVYRVFDLWDQDCSKSEISRRTGVSRSQIRLWLTAGLDVVIGSPMRTGEPTSGQVYSLRHRSQCALIVTVDPSPTPISWVSTPAMER